MKTILDYVKVKGAGLSLSSESYKNPDILTYPFFRNWSDYTLKEDLYEKVQNDIDRVIKVRLQRMLGEANAVLRNHEFPEVDLPLTDYGSLRAAIIEEPLKWATGNLLASFLHEPHRWQGWEAPDFQQSGIKTLSALTPILERYDDKDGALGRDLFHFFGLYYQDVRLFNLLCGDEGVRIKKQEKDRRDCIMALKRCEKIKMQLRRGKVYAVSIYYLKKVYPVPDLCIELIMQGLNKIQKRLLKELGDVDLLYKEGDVYDRVRLCLIQVLGESRLEIQGGRERDSYTKKFIKKLNAIYWYLMDARVFPENYGHVQREQVVRFIIAFLGIEIGESTVFSYIGRSQKQDRRVMFDLTKMSGLL